MYVVISMAGEGRRFRDRGISEPKYEIVVQGKPIFDWALESLRSFFGSARFVFVARSGACDFIEDRCLTLGIARPLIVELDHITDGQATTVSKVVSTLEESQELLIYNIDTHLVAGSVAPDDIGVDDQGWLLLFTAPGDHWSFAKRDSDGRVTAVSEKVRISEYASVGLYYFKSVRLFREAYRTHAQWVRETYREVYVMPLYQALLDQQQYIGSKVIAFTDVIPLGTPDEVARFDPGFRKRLLGTENKKSE